MAGVKTYSTTPGNNNVSGALFPELQNPSTVNDNMRQVQADLASHFRSDGWRELGDGDGSGVSSGGTDYTFNYLSATSGSFTGIDTTAIYLKGRRVKATVDGGSTIYGIIASSTFSTDTTVTFQWDSGALSNGVIRLWVGEHTPTNESLAVGDVKEVPQTASISSGAVTLDVAHGTIASISLTENVTSLTITWPSGAASFTMITTQDATGSRTFAFPGAWKWSNGVEGTITSDASATDMFEVFSPDGGTTVYAFQSGINLS